MAYTREYYQKNKDEICQRTRARQKRVAQRRRDLLSEFSCVACGCDNHHVIQWHHVDPTEKETQVVGNGVSEERFWDEVLKCVPLCANCHVMIHKNKLCLINPFAFKLPKDSVSTSAVDSTSPQ